VAHLFGLCLALTTLICGPISDAWVALCQSGGAQLNFLGRGIVWPRFAARAALLNGRGDVGCVSILQCVATSHNLALKMSEPPTNPYGWDVPVRADVDHAPVVTDMHSFLNLPLMLCVSALHGHGLACLVFLHCF
jgi:hypothetical protein